MSAPIVVILIQSTACMLWAKSNPQSHSQNKNTISEEQMRLERRLSSKSVCSYSSPVFTSQYPQDGSHTSVTPVPDLPRHQAYTWYPDLHLSKMLLRVGMPRFTSLCHYAQLWFLLSMVVWGVCLFIEVHEWREVDLISWLMTFAWSRLSITGDFASVFMKPCETEEQG